MRTSVQDAGHLMHQTRHNEKERQQTGVRCKNIEEK